MSASHRMGPLCVLACQWSGSSNFWVWAGVQGTGAAKDFIVQTCGVKSRKDLDHSKTAGALFHSKIRLPYMAFLANGASGHDLEVKLVTAAKLLAHGPLSTYAFTDITGWPTVLCEVVLARLVAAGKALYLGRERDLYCLP